MSIFTWLGLFLKSVFGEVSWRPPRWLTRLCLGVAVWSFGHRRASAGILAGLLLAVSGGWSGYQWYQHRPKPVTISVKVESPGVTALVPEGKDLVFPKLNVVFGGSVMRVSDTLDKALDPGARLEPPIEGQWRWVSDSRLAFTPKHDWPAGQKYRVIFDRTLFASHVHLEKYELQAVTPVFSAKLKESEFYIDPTQPDVKQITATFEFTHAVDAVELEKSMELSVVGGSAVFKPGVSTFSLRLGAHKRIAYLRTSALTLPEREDFLRMILGKRLHTIQGGAVLHEEVEKKVRIPDVFSFFRISSVEGTITRTNEGEPEQVIVVTTSSAAKQEEIGRVLKVYLLPAKKVDDKPAQWEGPQEIEESVLREATLLPFKPLPTDKEFATVHAFKINVEATGQLFVTLPKGIRALGGFVLGEEFASIIGVPELPNEITIQGSGAVLALSGERKLSIKSRGIGTIEYEIARVPADQINHLVSQTSGEFQNPEFNYRFNEENIARIATERQTIAMQSRFKANYSAFDFARHLRPADDGGSPMQGLFFLKAREWKQPKAKAVDKEDESADEEDEDENEDDDSGSRASDGRFILVTDIGMIVKENADGSRDVFLASIKTGMPIIGVPIDILAKNGVPMITATTGGDGRASFASLGKPVREKRPVAFVARNGADVAFMPYSREDRKLDYSRFQIGGVESKSGSELDAFIFTERGIYRPGDEIRIGLIVKQRDWQGKLEGLPIEVEIIDARGTSVQARKLALPEMGFAETSYQTAYESPTGVYQIAAYVVRNGKRDLLLGSTTATVKEFLPDRMKIESRLTKENKGGWVTPEGISAHISLQNLYGSPAMDRALKAHVVLRPAYFRFPQFADYEFFDRLRAERKVAIPESHDLNLGETKTDASGAGEFDLGLDRIDSATYAATFYVEGFEADGGRSVSTSNSLLVSSLAYVVGTKPEGDLSYIPMGTQRSVHWIALDPAAKMVGLDKVECRLIEQRYLSVLAKGDNGNWAYQSVLKENIISTSSLQIPADGLTHPLPTDVPGNFRLELRDGQGALVSKVAFSVVGRGAVSRSLERDAELEVKLSKGQYNSGEEIELSVVAPYTGSGLITIERDKVYAHAWFKADRTSSVQRIRVPEGFEGTGYVNVCFVRALDSKEIFMSPLSYAAVPFQANIEKRRLPITFTVAERARPGEPLRISYKTDRPSRIAIFAVDQGILQVTGYELPNPLAHFFRKCALMVETTQIVDLILPEFSILRSAAAFGGDGEAKHLNPFKRVTEKPVVFWSGIIDAEPRERQVVYDVPDYFSGTLTVMAVAVAPDGVGSVEKNAFIRGPFVLTPNVPTVAAPGDTFDVSVTVNNGVDGSGEKAEVNVTAEGCEHLEIVKRPEPSLLIPEDREITTAFTVRAKEKFGSATLSFRARTAGQESKIRSTLSVRPAVPFMTTLRGGNLTKDRTDVQVSRPLHPDYRRLEATVSALPLGLARGLDTYLKNYPNGCSEQITSAAFCRLLLSDEADFGLSKREVLAQMEHTFSTLRRRQNEHGSFGYWAADNSSSIDFVSVYVMHFLIEAKAAGFTPPAGLLQAGLRHLQEMVVLEPGSLRDARVQAYAIYLLTRESVITTNYILNLRDYLEKNCAKTWQGDLTAVYLAGAQALMKNGDEAQKLVRGYRMGVHDKREAWDFHSPLAADAQYVAMISRHFPDLLKKIDAERFALITEPVSTGHFSTLSAAYAVLALKSYSQHLAKQAPELGIAELLANKRENALRSEGSALLKRAPFSAEATALRFSARNRPSGIGAFFQVIEAGYDRTLPVETLSQGLEVFREFLDEKGALTSTAKLGEPIRVRVRVRSTTPASVTNVAILDLLPGGFELAAGSLQPGIGSAGCDYVEVREDRVVFFTTVHPQVREITYAIKPTNRGQYVIPPVVAESMYDPSVKARALAGRISVVDR